MYSTECTWNESKYILFLINLDKELLTSAISSNLNIEFIYCILYGLSELFINKKNRDNITINNINNTTIHTIHYKKYLQSITNSDYSNRELSNNISSLSLFNASDNSKLNNNEHDALIIEYYDTYFKEIRNIDEITNDIIINSFLPQKNQNSIKQMMESKGKSGSFFFHSYDHKFLIKTITSEELDLFITKFAEPYHKHMMTYKDSLIIKIYGLYSIIIQGISEVHFIIMQNLLNVNHTYINRIFDLKGCTIKRKTKNINKVKRIQALKDLDYQWITRVDKTIINFSFDQIEELQYLLKNDLQLFKALKLMDYSLLLIIIDFPNNTDSNYDQILSLLGDPKYIGHIYKSRNEKYIYIIGIIDFLQQYNCKKWFENKYKALIYGNDVKKSSSVDSDYYCKRFFNFIINDVFIYGNEAD